MSFFALIIVFLLEQLRPLDYRRWVQRPFHAWTDFLEQRLNAGSYYHGIIGGCLALLPFLLLTGVILGLLRWTGWLLPELALNVLVLYVTMGFRQFSHFYTDIQMALRLEDEDRASAILAEWQNAPVTRHDSSDIARQAIETALAASYRHVFAVLFWFAVLGPLGALLYRLAHLLAEHWRHDDGDEFGKFSQQWLRILDWLPARLTAIIFAAMGNFMDAVYGWRYQTTRWPDPGLGIVLASGAGALGVRLGIPVAGADTLKENNELGAGEAADVDSMQDAIGLVWRAVVAWLLLCLLLLFILWLLAKLAG
jgi:cobalamin biosynthesis protein CobD/CbiB